METSISNSPIQLSNTSSSYAQYLESLPNNRTKEYNQMAQIALKASKYLLNNNCKKYVSVLTLKNGAIVIASFHSLKIDFRIGADDKKCVEVISTHKLPKSDLLDHCEQLHSQVNKSVNIYRRLLPADYVDGLSKVLY